MLESLKTSCDPQLNSVDSRSPKKHPVQMSFAVIHTQMCLLDILSFQTIGLSETGGGRVAVEADEEKDLVEEEEDVSTRSKVEDEEEVSTRSNVSLSK